MYSASASGGSTSWTGPLAEGLQRLEALLRDNDAAATDVLETIRSHNVDVRWATVLREVENAMDNFDFDTALEALQRART